MQLELNRVTESSNKLKEQQELIVRMEKMAVVGRITSSIAHSIRNPLMIIGGFARSMLSRPPPPGDPKRDFIDSIVSEARQLEGVLDEILNYSDSLYPTRDFWDANQMVETTLKDLSGHTPAERARVPFRGRQQPSPRLYRHQAGFLLCADPDHQRDRRPELAKASGIQLTRHGDLVQLRVEDKGRSVSQEEMDLLLTPFAITHDMGTGVGLALCRTMLEKQDIPLTVSAPPEGGIIYTITFPTRKE